ncbi:hypothetical protein Droror1_Dr00028119 [Drosera rotundifolia]
MPALRFKTCRLLLGNVWNRKLTKIQRRILRKLRNKKRSIKKKIYSRKNLNNYIQLQTTRKLSLFYGNLPITKMHRRTERTSYIPFLLNLETRLDVLPVRLHFSETIPQARQLISHRKVCVNNSIVSITHFKVSHGDIISFKENDARTRGEEIRRSFYIKISVEKIIGKFFSVRMWRRTKTKWFRLLKTKKGCRLLLKSRFLQKLRSSMQKKDLERRRKKFGSDKVCLGNSFAEHNRMKRNLYHLKSLFLSKKRRKEKNRDLPSLTIRRILAKKKENRIMSRRRVIREAAPSYFIRKKNTRRRSLIVVNSTLDSKKIYCSASSHQFTMRRRIKRIELPTHYSEVNHRTLKAAVSYGPNIGNIPHDIRLKDPNLPLRSGNGRGQNI